MSITGFSMSFLICLTKLMVVIVMLFMITNQNMDISWTYHGHIMDISSSFLLISHVYSHLM